MLAFCLWVVILFCFVVGNTTGNGLFRRKFVLGRFFLWYLLIYTIPINISCICSGRLSLFEKGKKVTVLGVSGLVAQAKFLGAASRVFGLFFFPRYFLVINIVISHKT